jgi:predicted amidohydrolase YtcJ
MVILTQANIYSEGEMAPQATALAIENGRIKGVGSDDDILAMAHRGDQIEEMEGKTIWPGLIDAHLHLENYAFSLQKIDCETGSLAECIEKVRTRAKAALSEDWCLGHGWNHNTWGGEYGTRLGLDQAAPANPVYLTAKSLHAGWANSRALAAAGITSHTPDPDGGRILRDCDGEPNGILLESAMGLVERVIPQPSPDQIAQTIDQAQTQLWSFGITGVHDFDRAACFSALQELHNNKKLKLRVVKSIPLENLESAIDMGLRSGFGNDTLRIGPLKLFADGALGPQTAAMLKPYENGSAGTGILLLDAEAIFDIGRRAVEHGINLAVHAIGDRANHETINAYSLIRRHETKMSLPHYRHRIEHVQILGDTDISRLAESSIIASMQPIHAISDMEMADRYWGSRCRNAYAWQDLITAGTRLAFGSDAPVENPNPFLGIYAAVSRRRLDGTPGPQGWHPSQRISLRDALLGYTCGPAFAAGTENFQGKILPGYAADLIIIPSDPFQLPINDLPTVQPEATMIAGEWVWRG